MNVRLFGLEISADGALRAIKQVTDASAKLAADGAKSAQLYADATREKLNRVAREYIPETVRAIEKLTSAEKALAQSSAGAKGTLPGLLSASEVSSAAAAYDKLFGVQQKVAAGQNGLATSAGSAFTGFGRIRQGLTSLVAQMTGTIPILDRVGSQLLAMGAGGNIALAIVGGLAVIGLAWRALTRDIRDAEKAQDEAAKKLEEWSRKRHLDSGGEFGEQVAGEAGHANRLLQEKGSVVALQSLGGAASGIAGLYDLFAGKTDKSVHDAVQALRDGRQVIGSEVTKNFLDIQGKEPRRSPRTSSRTTPRTPNVSAPPSCSSRISRSWRSTSAPASPARSAHSSARRSRRLTAPSTLTRRSRRAMRTRGASRPSSARARTSPSWRSGASPRPAHSRRRPRKARRRMSARCTRSSCRTNCSGPSSASARASST
jgi:hypothetical protein